MVFHTDREMQRINFKEVDEQKMLSVSERSS
jgi:hypothetical protein